MLLPLHELKSRGLAAGFWGGVVPLFLLPGATPSATNSADSWSAVAGSDDGPVARADDRVTGSNPALGHRDGLRAVSALRNGARCVIRAGGRYTSPGLTLWVGDARPSAVPLPGERTPVGGGIPRPPIPLHALFCVWLI